MKKSTRSGNSGSFSWWALNLSILLLILDLLEHIFDEVRQRCDELAEVVALRWHARLQRLRSMGSIPNVTNVFPSPVTLSVDAWLFLRPYFLFSLLSEQLDHSFLFSLHLCASFKKLTIGLSVPLSVGINLSECNCCSFLLSTELKKKNQFNYRTLHSLNTEPELDFWIQEVNLSNIRC